MAPSDRVKLPGLHKKLKASGKLPSKAVRTDLTNDELRAACGGDKYPICLDLCAPYLRLTSQEFLARISPNCLKELDLSENELVELNVLGRQAKLRRLAADKNCLSTVCFVGLEGLQHVSLRFNALRHIPDLSSLAKVQYLSLRGNRVASGFPHLARLPSLRFLDLSKNDIDVSAFELFHELLLALKQLSKLQFLCLDDNPVASKIADFRLFVISELPKIEFLDMQRITKEERVAAFHLEDSGAFAAKHTKPKAKAPASLLASLPASAPAAQAGGQAGRTPAAQAPLKSMSSTAALSSAGGKQLDLSASTMLELESLLTAAPSEPPAGLQARAKELQEASAPARSASMGTAAAASVSNAPRVMEDAGVDYDELMDEMALLAEGVAGAGGGMDDDDDMSRMLDDLAELAEEELADASTLSLPGLEGVDDPVFDLLEEMMADAGPTRAASARGERGSGFFMPATERMVADLMAAGDDDLESMVASLGLEEEEEELVKAPLVAPSTPAPPVPAVPDQAREEEKRREEEMRRQEEERRAAAAKAEAEMRQKEEEAKERLKQLQASEAAMAEENRRKQQELEERLAREKEEARVRQEEARKEAEEQLRLLQEREAAMEEELHRRQKEVEERLAKQVAEQEALQERMAQQQRKAREEEERRMEELKARQAEAERRLAEQQAKLEEQRREEEKVREAESRRLLQALADEHQREQQAEKERNAAAEAQRQLLEADASVDHWLSQLTDDPTSTRQAQEPQVDSRQAQELQQRLGTPLELCDVQLLQQMGVGTFGATFRAIYRAREVAGKRLACNMYTSDAFLASFRAQLAAAAALQHEGLARVEGAVTRNQLLLVRQLVQGTPLYGLLRNRGVALGLEEKLRIARQVVAAVGHLHAADVPARCIKSRNVVVSSEGQAVLTDYGLLCVKEHVRQSGAAGTPQYEAPEVLAGSQVDEQAADVFAFGRLLWEMLAEEAPYAGRMAREVAAAVLQGEQLADPPASPVVLCRIIRACTHPQPASRPSLATVAKLLAQPAATLLQYGVTDATSAPGTPLAPSSAQAGGQRAVQQTQQARAAGTQRPAVGAVAERIVQLLATPHGSQKATAAIENVAKTESNAEALAEAGVAGALEQQMRQGDVQARARACRAVALLAAWQEPRRKCLEAGSTLVGLMGDGTDLVAVQAARAVVALAADRQGRRQLLQAGVVPAAVGLMQRQADACKTQAAWAMAALAEEEEGQRQLVQAGGVKQLLQVLSHSQNPAVHFRALVALSHLAANRRLQALLAKAQVLPRFLRLLHASSPALRSQALVACERILRQPLVRSQVVQEGGLEPLVRLLDEDALVPPALQALAHLAHDSDHLAAFVRANGLRRVVHLLASSQPLLVSSAVAFLDHFVALGDRQRDISRAVGLVPYVTALLASSEAETRSSAVTLLARLLSSPRCAQDAANAGAVAALVSLMESERQPMAGRCAAAVAQLLAADADAKEAFVASGAAPALVPFAGSEEEGSRPVLLLLAELVADPEVAEAVAEVGGAGVLADGLGEEGEERQQLMAGLLHMAAQPACQDAVAADALPGLLPMLQDAQVSTPAIKCVVMLCKNPIHYDALRAAGTPAALQPLVSHPKLGPVAAKCLQLLG